jgi:phosphoenolpyruvate synthase/pyruvate phosphate dikinase
MSTNMILKFDDATIDLEIAGGKGASLAKLVSAKFPVPEGFIISTSAYKNFVLANKIQDRIQGVLQKMDASNPASLEEASTAIRSLFTQAPIPKEMAEAIIYAYAALPGKDPAVAVRSSATAEDLPDASFAGQQDTFLNISAIDPVLDAVRKCWASLWTARAIGYRARLGISPDQVALAVVVQTMVEAKAAGVMFTLNPVNGSEDEVLINAAWGLGESVVGGEVTPDTLTINKQDGKLVKREIATKQVMTVFNRSGTAQRPVPTKLQNKPVLTDSEAKRLMQIGVQIETLYGSAVDIEWALADGQIAILQARPVTAAAEKPVQWIPPDPKGVYMRTSVTDLTPKPLSPLYMTLGIPSHVEQMEPLSIRLTGSKPVLPKDYFTCINGYSYMNSHLPANSIWWAITGLFPVYIRIFTNKLTPLWREELLPNYRKQVAGKQGSEPAQMSSSDLWQDVQDLVGFSGYYIGGLMFTTMGASAGSEGLLTTVYNKMVKKEGDPDASVMLMGWDNIAVRSEKSLYDLAGWIQGRKELAAFFISTPSGEIVAQLSYPSAKKPKMSGWDEFEKRFHSHLEEFGHLIYQLDFAEPLPLDQPELLIESIKLMLEGKAGDPYKRQKASEQERLETTRTMLERVKGVKAWLFRWALTWGQTMAPVREDALAEIGLAYPRIRSLLAELGKRFAKAGAIHQKEDIYWLEKEEVNDCASRMEQGQSLQDFSIRIAERQEYNRRMALQTPPPMVPYKKRVMGIKAEAFLAQSGENKAGNLIKGVPTSPGKVTAPACVLQGASDFGQMRPGDVLIAGATTPAWTPLFTMAAALVTDIGGPLSHGSIVAREYGIPAVMGTGVATRRIQSGQMITVDGNAGTVEISENR